MRPFQLLGCLALLSAPLAASSRDVTVAARTGYGHGVGNLAADAPLRDQVSGQVPVGLELGWRASPLLTFGGYAAYGFGTLYGAAADHCDRTGGQCEIRELRLGVRAELAVARGRSLAPWVAAHAGWERLSQSVDAPGPDVRAEYRGWEVGIEGGADRAFGALRIGPFVGAAAGVYVREHLRTLGVDGSSSIPDRGVHGWLTIGLRLAVDL